MNAHEIYDDYDSSSHKVSDQSEDQNYDQSSYDDSYYPPPSQSYGQIRPHRASRKHQTALPFLSGSPQSGEDEGWGDDYSTAENASGAATEGWRLPERPNRRRVETDTTPTRPATLGRGTRVAPPPRRPPPAPRPRPPTIRIGLDSQPVEEPRKIHPDVPVMPPTNSFADSNGHNQMPPRPQRKPLPAFPPQPTDQPNRGPGAFLSASDRNVAVRRPDPNPTQRQPPQQINPQPFQPRPPAIPHQPGIQRQDRATDNLNATLPRRPVRPTPPHKNIPAYNSMKDHPKMKAKAREYKDQSGPEGFCYSMGDIPDLVLTEKFLKKVAVVFQSESFLKEQGIFRISGSLVNVDAIVEQFLQGDTFLESLNNPHEVAHAIKNALKRSHALIPHHNRSLLLKIFADNKNEPIDVQIESIQTAVSRIGPRNYECLRILMSILSRVNEYAQFNDMNAHNLAVVFAPILMPQVFAGPPTAEEYAFLCLLIVHYHDVFQVCTKD